MEEGVRKAVFSVPGDYAETNYFIMQIVTGKKEAGESGAGSLGMVCCWFAVVEISIICA